MKSLSLLIMTAVVCSLAVAKAKPKAKNQSAAKDYENFSLPTSGQRIVTPESRTNYASSKVTLSGKNVRVYQPEINSQQFIFAKEAFISEKREEAIKLLRLELEAGAKGNRDNVLLRLGQLYAEKYMELSYRENEVYTEMLSRYERDKAAGKKTAPPRLDNSRSKGYLKDALKIFYSLEKEYPRHHKIDEIKFFIGFVELEQGNNDKGYRYLEEVVRKYPQSRKFDEAVVYLGDSYFEKHKFAMAAAKYRILLGRGNADLLDYAVYKLAWCRLNTGESRKGLEDMKGLVKRLADSQDKAKFALREQALKDLVIFYGETEQVEEAMSYFTDLQGRDKALENLKLIAEILKSKAKDISAARAYTQLLKEFGDSLDGPKMTLGLYDSLAQLAKSEQASKVLSEGIERYGENSEWAGRFPKEKAAEVKAAQDLLSGEAAKIAMFHHQAGQKSANKGHYAQALQIYSALLANYPSLPDRKKIAFYRAEIFYSQGKWLDAANSYMDVAKLAPKDKITDESVYNALLALDKLTAKSETLSRYSKEEQKTVNLTPESIPSDEKRFIEVGEYYVQEYPKGARVVDIQFRIASIYYKHRHFDESQKRFKDIALAHPSHRSATTAAHIVLDIYNIKKDYESLNSHAGLFASTKGLGDAKFREEMASISGEIGFKSIEKTEAQNQWASAGDQYMSFYQANSTGPLAERALYNALVSYEKAKDDAKTAETTRLFLSKYPKSTYAPRLVLSQAKQAERAYDLDTAQKLYAEYAKRFSGEKEAKKALYNAAVFAEMLEYNGQALTLYGEYVKAEKPNAEEQRSIDLSMAKLYRKEKSWDKFTQIYRRLLAKARTLDEKLALLGEMARQYDSAGRGSEKAGVLAEMRSLYEGAGTKPKGSGVQWVAEAKLKSLEKQRQKYEEIPLRFPPQDLVYLLKRKQKALTKLAASYDEVVDVGVPEWGVAALLEKATAYENFVKMYRSVKIPKSYKEEEVKEAEASLKQIDGQMVAPLEKTAQEILKVCVAKASEFHVANEYAAKCEAKNQSKPAEDGASIAVSPSGLQPEPSYWSTRSLNWR